MRSWVHWVHRHTSAHTPLNRHSTSVLLLLCSPVDRPGVLVLEVLEVHEECSMQLAHCEHHQPPGDDLQHSNPEFKESARMLVLFNRETAAQLSPAPRDIIHIYPPWWEDTVHVAIEWFSALRCFLIFGSSAFKKHVQSLIGKNAVPALLKLDFFKDKNSGFWLWALCCYEHLWTVKLD